jgi:hypothetical protein
MQARRREAWEARRRVAQSGGLAPGDGRHVGPGPATWRWSRSRGYRVTATPPRSGGTTTRGAATPTTALAGTTTAVGGGRLTRAAGTAGVGRVGAPVDGGRGAWPPVGA